MTYRRLLVFLLVAPAFTLAGGPSGLSGSAYDALEQRLAPLTAKYPGVSFVFPRAELTKGWANVNYKPVRSESDAMAYVDLFVEEFSKYPADFIKASGLKRVELVEGLAVGSQFRAAVPNYVFDVLYYDVSYVYNQRYTRHVIHHEFYHMLEHEWNGSTHYQDPNWARLNDRGFKYGGGGMKAYGRGDVWSFIHPQPGFMNLYSTYGLEEDKAEVWAVLFVADNWKLVKSAVAEDPILRAKVDYMRDFGSSKSALMDAFFWDSVLGEASPLPR